MWHSAELLCTNCRAQPGESNGMEPVAVTAQRRTPGTLERYGVAIGTVMASALLTYFLARYIQHTIFIFFIAAVFFTAWYGGIGPAVLTTIAGLLVVDYFFIVPFYSFG